MYPTKNKIIDEINNNPTNKSTVKTLKKWKKNHYTKKWSKKEKEEKHKSIENLIKNIYNQHYPTKKIKIKWDNKGWRYVPHINTIYGKINNISIISALHETGHAIYGESETKACAFSVELFSLCFPSEFNKLKWVGHMLKK